DFSGIIPVTGDRALPDNFSVQSLNTWLYGSELRGIHPPLNLIALTSTTRKVLRIPKGTVGGDPAYPTMVSAPSYLGGSIWVQFTDRDTDIVRGQLVEDTFKRWYFCSPTTGPMFNTYARMLSGLPPYRLGCAGPSIDYDGSGNNPNKPAVGTPTGGAAPAVSHNYVYTWVNEFGEESSPSLPSGIVSHNTGATVPLSHIVNPPATTSDQPNWKEKKIYRTVSGSTGETMFYYVNPIPLTHTPPAAPTGAPTYDDDTSKQTDAVIVNNLPLESTKWAV